MKELIAISGFVAENAPLFVSLLALLASVGANVTAERARRASKRIEAESERRSLTEKQSEMFIEVERQQATVGELLTVIALKILIYQENHHLLNEYKSDYERLSENLDHLRKLETNQNKHLEAIDAIGDSGSLLFREKSLAQIRRLTVRLQGDLANEERGLQELRQRIGA